VLPSGSGTFSLVDDTDPDLFAANPRLVASDLTGCRRNGEEIDNLQSIVCDQGMIVAVDMVHYPNPDDGGYWDVHIDVPGSENDLYFSGNGPATCQMSQGIEGAMLKNSRS
jgi:hypothetical protein